MLSYLFSFFAGTLTAVSPCVLPILPLVLGSAIQENKHAPLAMASGLIISFTTLGVGVVIITEALGLNSETIRIGSAFFLIILGFSFFVPYLQRNIQKWLAPTASFGNSTLNKLRINGYAGHVVTGLFLGLIWSPCVGPALGSAIGLAVQGNLIKATLIMFLFSVGAAIPLLFVAYGSRAVFLKNRDKFIASGENVKSIFGMVLVITGVLVVFGFDKKIEAVLIGVMPDWTIKFLTQF